MSKDKQIALVTNIIEEYAESLLNDRGMDEKVAYSMASAIVEALRPNTGNTEPDGFYLPDTSFCEWPDKQGIIRVKNEHGDVIEELAKPDDDDWTVDAARWRELRDMMPVSIPQADCR
jgi:hypothetical protein